MNVRACALRAHAVAFTFFLPSWPSQRVGGGGCCCKRKYCKNHEMSEKDSIFHEFLHQVEFCFKKKIRRFAPNFFLIFDVRVAFFLGASRAVFAPNHDLIRKTINSSYKWSIVKNFSRLRRDRDHTVGCDHFAPQARKIWGYWHQFPFRNHAKVHQHSKFFWPPKAAETRNPPFREIWRSQDLSSKPRGGY